MKFTPAAAHAEPGRGRSQEKLLSIQLAALQLLPRRIVGGNTPTNTNAHKEPLSAKQKAPSSLQLSQKELREKRNTGALMHVALPRAGGVWRDFA